MPTNEHGKCVHCDFDLNGEWIWEVGLRMEGTEEGADAYASCYGASKGKGRFGKEIYVKPYDENYNKLEPYYECPECGEKCYEE